MNLDKILALYQASNSRVPSYMGECAEGATTRGNSPHDRFASPETRDKVLQARVQEIEHFARDRSLPAATVFAIAEASMRTGKIPDLGQYGLAGDDAVATKHFVLSQVLNLQIDDEQPDAPAVQETVAPVPVAPAQQKKISALAQSVADFMGESSTSVRLQKGKLAETVVPNMAGLTATNCGRGNANVGASATPTTQDTEKVDLLPKAVMQKLRELKGVDVSSLSHADLVKLARDRGLLGTDESVAGTVPSGAVAETTARANVDMVHLLTAASRGRTLGGASVTEPSSIELTQDAPRSEADKLLGIEKGDPRGETWPKLSPELARLMNLEDNRYLAPRPGARMPEPPKVQAEATTMGSVGGFMTAGNSLINQSIPKPSFDASQDLPTSEAKRKQILADILKKHGLRPE